MCHCPQKQRKKKKKTNCLCATTHGHFCPLSSLFSSFSFFLHFEEKTFRWAQKENTWTQLSIFLPPYPTKHTPKKFFFPFSLKSFSSTLFHLQTNTLYESNQIEKKKTHTHTQTYALTQILEPLTIQIYHLCYMSTQHNKRRNKKRRIT